MKTSIIYCRECVPVKILAAGFCDSCKKHEVDGVTHTDIKTIRLEDPDPVKKGEAPDAYFDRLITKYASKMV